MVVDVKAMELKKTQQITAEVSKETTPVAKKVQAESFIGEIKDEIKRISWTNLEELQVYTKIVVGATFFCGLGIYVIDLLIQSCLSVLEFSVRWIAG